MSVVSIGVAYKGVVVVGVIFDPYRNELFTATQGGGAFCNGEPIAVSGEKTVASSLLAFGAPACPADGMAPKIAMYDAAGAVVCRGCRNLGTAAMHLTMVASGRLTGFFQLDLNAWDLAAGALLVQEAGGVTQDSAGAPYTLQSRNICFSNGLIQEELVAFLAKRDASTFVASCHSQQQQQLIK
jgi:myo-inositol-1(or 4)-monophosphatase